MAAKGRKMSDEEWDKKTLRHAINVIKMSARRDVGGQGKISDGADIDHVEKTLVPKLDGLGSREIATLIAGAINDVILGIKQRQSGAAGRIVRYSEMIKGLEDVPIELVPVVIRKGLEWVRDNMDTAEEIANS